MLRDVFYYGAKPNAHPREKFANSLEDARQQATTEYFWIINEFCDYRNFDWDFDFDFLPDEDIWAQDHNNVWPSQHQKDSGTWLCPKEHSDIIIYRADVNPVIRKNIKHDAWVILEPIDETKFDFSWHPDPTSPPYIHKWGCKFFPVETKHFVEYHVPGATDSKFMNSIVDLLPEKNKWKILELIDETKFDFSWRPNPTEPAYIYTWGSKWVDAELKPVLEYHSDNATERKYMPEKVALLPEKDKWKILESIDETKFDFTWRPNPTEPAYIYTWGNQWHKAEDKSSVQYCVEGATDYKYMDQRMIRKPCYDNWVIPEGFDADNFDFSWEPNPNHEPAIYQFGSVLGKTDGPQYVVPNNNNKVLYLENVYLNKEIIEQQEINQYYIETTLEDLIQEHPEEIFWALNKDLDYTNFNFDWRPDMYQANYIHAFGVKDNLNTQTYFVNSMFWDKGERNINYVETDNSSIKTALEMFYIDKGNKESTERFNKLKFKFPNLQKTRYLNSWVDTINRCVRKSSTKLFWILNSELDYTDFDFDYYPDPWKMNMVHVFGTQWSHWGTTFLVNKEQFPVDTKYIKIIEHLSTLNFVKNIKAKATLCLHDIIFIDYKNKESENVLNQIKKKTDNNIIVVDYETDYLQTIKNALDILTDKKEHYVWICSSICDYSDFDFSYICDPFARDQLHVFPSDLQDYGDTFFVDVNKAKAVLEDILTLEDFEEINFNKTMRVKRLPAPVIVSDKDSLVSEVEKIKDWPYAILTTKDEKDLDVSNIEPMSLWSSKSKNIIVASTGGTKIVAPRETKNYIKKELYDYPYIITSNKLAVSNPMDIVFLSNGETGAEENWEHLQNTTKNIKNRVVRVDGVNGRVQAYHAALKASNTPWAFTVFAKLKVDENFDWSWQPDRLQVPKHYIFQAKNPVNGLIYGHQAMIAYNKKLTLANNGTGLDFTLDDEHEVVDVLSGTAIYNTDPFSTWRTAFREVIKLRAENSLESNKRLNAWLNNAEGDFAEYSTKGATDAYRYYAEVEGDFDKLKLSYEWNWLKDRFDQS